MEFFDEAECWSRDQIEQTQLARLKSTVAQTRKCDFYRQRLDEAGVGPDSLRNLDDLRRIVQSLTQRGVRMEFVKEGLTFTGEDSPMANLMLSVMGAFAEFERSLIRERQREGIALAKQRGAYRGRKKSLNNHQIVELKQRIAAGEQKTLVAHNFGISRETLYQYLRES